MDIITYALSRKYADGQIRDVASKPQRQATKLGVTGSIESPHTVELEIPRSADFKRYPVEVLKFVPSEGNQVITVASFDNDEADDFLPNDFVQFDGTMSLKTSYSVPMVDEGPLGAGRLFSATINRSAYKSIQSIEVI